MPESPDNLLPPSPAMPEPTLFDSPSVEAGRVAARYAKVRYQQILQYLRAEGARGGCIFEIAAAIGCFDHQISGRFGDLEKDGLILRTGHTRNKPDTGCKCSVYTITLTGLAVANHVVNVAQSPPAVSPPAGGKAP